MNAILRCLIFVTLAFFGAVQLYAQEQAEGDVKALQKVYRDQDKISVQIREALSELANGKSLYFGDEVIFTEKLLPEFYKCRSYTPAWSSYVTLLDALDALEHSWEDGLTPADYHTGQIRKVVSRIKERLGDNIVDYQAVARFDILVTDAVLLYAYHLLEGKVNPESLYPNWNYSFRDIEEGVPAKLQEAIEKNKVAASLYSLRPRFLLYQSYSDLLVEYRVLEAQGGWSTIGGGKLIEPGEEDPRIPQIRSRLQKTGELTAYFNMDSLVYDDQLKADIEMFQKANGLSTDGIIGPATLEALNESLEERIEKVRVNMERVRWIANEVSDCYIVVNIPAFKAYYIENNRMRFNTNVVVGRTYTKTPVFKNRLAYIEFNPPWIVPASIVRSSIIPDLRKDPEFLQKNHYDLLDRSGNKLDASRIDFTDASASNFPYIVRQRPGSWNALGLVKFIFPNKYTVYMHDTPTKVLFEHSARAFSHGCIRIQEPFELAAILLEGTEYDKIKIDQVIKSGEITRVKPVKDIDVMLLYWTVGYNEDRKLVFYKDIYKRDGKVLEQLNSKCQRLVNREED